MEPNLLLSNSLSQGSSTDSIDSSLPAASECPQEKPFPNEGYWVVSPSVCLLVKVKKTCFHSKIWLILYVLQWSLSNPPLRLCNILTTLPPSPRELIFYNFPSKLSQRLLNSVRDDWFPFCSSLKTCDLPKSSELPLREKTKTGS